MRRISGYFIRILIVIITFSIQVQIQAQDTILIPLKVNVGLDILGPAIYLAEKNTFSMEGYVSAGINEKISAFLGAGYTNYEYSQYNYTYLNNGTFLRAGADFNLLKPKKSLGKYWAGVGLRYGLSHFNSEVPSFQQENYWGSASSSIPPSKSWGHFLEASPGVRAEIFRNFSIGWTISLRLLLYAGKDKNLKPIYIPGFGNGEKRVAAGINYFIAWNIPYKKIKVIVRKEETEESEESEDTEDTKDTGNFGTSGNTPQSSGEFR